MVLMKRRIIDTTMVSVITPVEKKIIKKNKQLIKYQQNHISSSLIFGKKIDIVTVKSSRQVL